MGTGRPQRQSRGQRKSYNFDYLKDILSDSDGETREPRHKRRVKEDSDPEVNDFVQEVDGGEDDDDDEEDPEEGAESVADDSDDEDGNDVVARAAQSRKGFVIDVAALEKQKGMAFPKAKMPKPKKSRPKKKKDPPKAGANNPATLLRQRGVHEWGTGGQESRYKDLFGPTHADLIPALASRDHWGSMSTLPSRAHGNLRHSFFIPDGAQEKEIRVTREWYSSTGQESFAGGQIVRNLKEEASIRYLSDSGSPSLNLLLGGLEERKPFTLHKGDFLNIAEPFQSKAKRRGWYLYLGSRIQEARWAPVEDSTAQYLAVATEQGLVDGKLPKELQNATAPAFAATRPFPASIQIWRFEATSQGDLDTDQEPSLACVICTEWGAPKRLRWCPIDLSKQKGRSDGVIQLGLLAGMWSDGKVRVLDIAFEPTENAPGTQYLHIKSAAFETTFPDAVPTCLHWLSGTSLAVASASGCLAIWSLNRPGVFPSTDSEAAAHKMPKPWFYKQVSDTYVLTLTSGYPSRPQYVSITSADGFSRLIDVRAPDFEVCNSIRGRSLVVTQDWHEQTQTFVMPDEHYLLKHNSVRRYYNNHYTMRLDSSLVFCATSPVHPCILLAGSDGRVVASNTLTRILRSKKGPWQQIWFKHEWRRPTDQLVKHTTPVAKRPGIHDPFQVYVAPVVQDEERDYTATPDAGDKHAHEAAQASTGSNVPPSLLVEPMVRVTEGYKPYEFVIQDSSYFQRYKDGAKFITIYEEKSCITSLSWNPNLSCGTWAVAGAASGLLRIEDLGV